MLENVGSGSRNISGMKKGTYVSKVIHVLKHFTKFLNAK